MLGHLTTIIMQFVQSVGYPAVFGLMLLESALIPIPSEVTMPFAGFLASQGHLSLVLVVLLGALGNLAGSLIGYYIGYALEEHVLLGWIRRYGKFLLLSEEDYHQSMHWFERFGGWIVFGARLLPAVRTFISLPAGAYRMKLGQFCALTFTGSLIWSGVLAYAGYSLGQHWELVDPYFGKFHVVIAALVVVAVVVYVGHKLGWLRRK